MDPDDEFICCASRTSSITSAFVPVHLVPRIFRRFESAVRPPTSSLLAALGGATQRLLLRCSLSVSSGKNVRRARGERVLAGLERVGRVGSSVSVVRRSRGAQSRSVD